MLSSVATDEIVADYLDSTASTARDHRSVGIALGILVERYKISVDEAFDVLLSIACDGGRSIVDVACDVLDSGHCPAR